MSAAVRCPSINATVNSRDETGTHAEGYRLGGTQGAMTKWFSHDTYNERKSL